jgi:hypothetical protein
MTFSRIIVTFSIALAVSVSLCSSLHARAGNVCLYASRVYSEGASICVGRALIISCNAAGERMVWTTIADQDTARACAPQAGWRSYARPLRTSVKSAPPPAQPVANAAKCFNFNGRQYCE